MKPKPQFIYILKPVRLDMVITGPNPEESQVLEQHLAYLQRLSDEGQVILFGRTQNADESTFGLVILEAESQQAAEQLMSDDPAVKGKLMSAHLYPYLISGARQNN